MTIKFLPKLNELCYALVTKGFDALEKKKTKNSVFRFALYIIRKNIFSLHKLKIRIPRTKESVIFNYSTTNQYNTLRTLMSHLPGNATSYRNIENTFNPRIHTLELLALMSIPRILFTFYFSNKETKLCLQKNIYQIYLSYGLYLWARLFYKKNKSIKILITANDHYFENVPFTFAANNCAISTIYIQHASVTQNFPKLTFTYSLLDGIDALEKYAIKGIDKTTVILTGNPKNDILLEDKNEQKENFGICVSRGDSYEEVISLIKKLKSHNLNLIVRPHPAVKKEWLKTCTSEGWPISNPSDENVFDFIKKITIMVSGDSNIILEGALYKKSIIYIASTYLYDYYGFVKNNIIDYEYKSQNDFIKNFQNDYPFPKKTDYNSLKRYNHSINTSFENKSTQFVCHFVKQITEGNDIKSITGLFKKDNYYEIQ